MNKTKHDYSINWSLGHFATLQMLKEFMTLSCKLKNLFKAKEGKKKKKNLNFVATV